MTLNNPTVNTEYVALVLLDVGGVVDLLLESRQCAARQAGWKSGHPIACQPLLARLHRYDNAETTTKNRTNKNGEEKPTHEQN
jgi:hypothetical protein